MKIAYVINSMEGGGAALPLPDIARALGAAGAELRVLALTRRNGLAIEPLAAAGVEVEVRDGGERDHPAALRWLSVRLEGADAVWTSLSRATLLGQLAARARRQPVVSWQHNAFLKPANRRLLRATQRLSILWVADSDAVTRLTAERLGVASARLMTWPIFAADADAPRAAPWRPGEPLRLGSLGRLHPCKGYDVLLDALAALRAGGWQPPVPVELTVWGEGAEREGLAARARAAGVTLSLPGFTADPREALATLHLYLQPSRREGFGVAAHQAMTAGVPVLASRVGELAASVTPACGRLVAAEDAGALAAALRSMLASPDSLALAGEAARTRVLARYGRAAFDARGSAVLDRLRSLSGRAPGG